MNPNNIQLFRKQGQSQVVDTQGNLVPFSGNLDTLPVYNQQNNVITTDALSPKTKIDLSGTVPPTPTPSVESDMAFFTDLQNQRTLQEQQLAEQKKAGTSEIDRLLGEIAGKPAEQLNLEQQIVNPIDKQIAEQSGLARTQLAEYNALKSEFEKMSADIEAGAGRKGLTTGAVMGQQGAVARAAQARLNTKASEIALTQANVLALQGQAEAAQKQVDRAINLKYSVLENELAIRQNQLDRIKEDLTAEEKKRWEAQQYALNKEEKRLAERKDEEKKSNEYLFTAIQGKAPQSLIAKAQDLINKGAKPNEVAKVLGQYSMSLADRLDIQLKQRQIAKINQELTTKNPDAGELVKINGKDYIRYKDGTISDPVLPEAADTGVVVSRLDNKLKTLSKLTKPSVALATSAGSLRGAPIPFAFKNQINDWRADAVNIIQKLTVDELGRVKSDGVTFGQLSNGERQAVGDAATALGAASIRDKEGNPTGRFRMSEKKVIEEFKKIYDGYALDFERRVGVPYQSYLQNPDAVKEKVVDDFIDQAGTSLINTNIYGGYSTQ